MSFTLDDLRDSLVPLEDIATTRAEARSVYGKHLITYSADVFDNGIFVSVSKGDAILLSKFLSYADLKEKNKSDGEESKETT